MMSNNEVENTITLRSFDGEEFVVTEAVGKMSQTIRHLIEDDCAEGSIPLPNVSAKVLAKVIEYCKMHLSDEDGGARHIESDECTKMLIEMKIENQDKEFINVDQEMLFDLLLAANYLDIKGLLDLTCKSVAKQMIGKTPEEIRKTFHIKNDYTPEEEEELRRELQWAFN